MSQSKLWLCKNKLRIDAYFYWALVVGGKKMGAWRQWRKNTGLQAQQKQFGGNSWRMMSHEPHFLMVDRTPIRGAFAVETYFGGEIRGEPESCLWRSSRDAIWLISEYRYIMLYYMLGLFLSSDVYCIAIDLGVHLCFISLRNKPFFTQQSAFLSSCHRLICYFPGLWFFFPLR